jgi:hypothetical protein
MPQQGAMRMRKLVVSVILAVVVLSAPPASAATWHRRADWEHIDRVLRYLNEKPPQRPVVYLLGGSAARECTVNDRNWRRQIVRRGGPKVLAFNLGASTQTYMHNIDMIRRAPDVPSLVLIGVNVGRYTRRPPASGVAAARGASLTLTQVDNYAQHRFRASRILSSARKRALLTEWLRTRYPVFQKRFAYNADRLRDLVAACQERGFGVVLFKLPVNLKIIRHRMDRPMARFRRNAEAVSAKYGVPWVDFVAGLRLANSDFVDNWHLVEPGRVKWQKRLTRTVVYWLKRYDIGQPAPTPTPTATPTPTPTATPTPAETAAPAAPTSS